MIYVSSGHEKGIGLEVFFKSAILFDQKKIDQFLLVGNKLAATNTLKKINLDFSFQKQKIIIGNTHIPFWQIKKDRCLSHSSSSILACLSKIKPHDILFTLPTTKSELKYKKKVFLGHTDFLRNFYKRSNLSMNFFSPQLKICLLTDHLPLADVSKNITSKLIVERISTSLQGMEKYFRQPKVIYLSGINPHAGEGGILGKEDNKISKAIKVLEKKYKKIKFIGPLSADMLHLKFEPNNSNNFFVYAHHDQALTMFKQKSRTLGANITFGLPFLRLSVDHGTAFDIYGKNGADYSGCFYNMKLALATKQK